MIRQTSRRMMFALTLMLFTTATTHIIAQSTTPSVVTGTDPVPHVVTGTDPVPQVVTGTNPEPQIDTVQLLLLISHLI